MYHSKRHFQSYTLSIKTKGPLLKWARHTHNESLTAQGTPLQLEKTSEIQYNIVCMAWLLDDGLVLMPIVKH